MSDKSNVIKISKKELSMVEDNSLNARQLQFLLAKTPSAYVKERPAKGGGKWKYVDGAYIRKVLNLMFGWDWDFEVVESNVLNGEVVVLGKLTCRVGYKKIVKMQYGNKDIMFKRGTKEPLSIGNDMKAAATDALKKCATELGLAQDVYNPESYKEIKVAEANPEIQRLETLIDEYNDTTLLEELKKDILLVEDKEIRDSLLNKLNNKLKNFK